MAFRGKRRLRRQIHESFTSTMKRTKKDWIQKKEIVEKGIEPSDAVLYELELAESHYSFLLKEAKVLFSDKPS